MEGLESEWLSLHTIIRANRQPLNLRGYSGSGCPRLRLDCLQVNNQKSSPLDLLAHFESSCLPPTWHFYSWLRPEIDIVFVSQFVKITEPLSPTRVTSYNTSRFFLYKLSVDNFFPVSVKCFELLRRKVLPRHKVLLFVIIIVLL